MMKTKARHLCLFSLAIAVVLLVALPLLSRPASANTYHSEHETAWTATGGTVAGGHYYLTEDVTATGRITVSGTVDLCLNGHTLNLAQYSLSPATDATLNICDCGGTGKLISYSTAIVTDSSEKDGNVNIYGGAIEGSTAIKGNGTDGKIAIYGGKLSGVDNGVTLDASCTMELHGGSVVGDASAITVSSNAQLHLLGGSVTSTGDVGIILNGGSLFLSGAPSVSGGANKDDVQLAVGVNIDIAGELTYQGGPISVLLADKATFPYALTDGWASHMSGKDYHSYFVASSAAVGGTSYKRYGLNDAGTGGELQFISHVHSWSYAKDPTNEYTVIATCVPENGDNLFCDKREGGSFTVSLPADLIYDSNEKAVTLDTSALKTGEEIAVSYTVAGQPATPLSAGTYTATASVVGNDNAKFSWPFTVSYLNAASVPDADVQGNSTTVQGALWYTGDVTLKAPTGYEIFSSPFDASGEAQTTLAVSEDMNGDFVYYLKDTATGKYAEKTVALRRDTKVPVFVAGSPSAEASDTTCTVTATTEDLVGIASYTVTYWQAGQAGTTSNTLSLAGLSPNTQYFYTVTVTDKLGNAATSDEASFTTARCLIPAGAVLTFDKTSYPYTGTAQVPATITLSWQGHSVIVDGTQFTVALENNVNAGTATVTVTAKASGDYNGSATGSFTITPKEVARTDVQLILSPNSFVYNGTAQKPTVTVTVGGVTLPADAFELAYLRAGTADACITAGTLTVKLVSLSNYTYTGEITTDFVIAKRAITVAAADQFADAETGAPSAAVSGVQVTGLPAGHTLHAVSLSLSATNAHVIEATAAVVHDAAGSDVTANYTVTYQGGQYHTLAWDADTKRYDCTQCDAYEDAGEDREAPTGTLILGGAFTAQGEVYNNTPYTGTLYSKALTLEVAAADALSGLKSISYYVAYEALDESALAAKIWRAYTDGGVAVDAENGKTVYLYVRLTDKADNVAYLSAPAVVVDHTAPTVLGITNGETYYVTQTVTLQDALSGLLLQANNCGWDASAILAGKTADLTLAGNREITYTFTLSDIVGNTAVVYQITMKPVSALSAEIDHLTVDNVTALDAPALRGVLAKVTGIKNGSPAATAEETDALQAIIDKCNTLLDKVQDVEEAIAYFDGLLAGYDIDTVTSADRADIDYIRESLATLAAGSVTAEQGTKLAELSGEADLLLGRIDETAAELARLRGEAAKYDITTVTTGDKPALEALEDDIEALLAGNNLTAAERAELEGLYTKVDTILAEVWKVADEIARLTEALDAYLLLTVKSSDKAAIEALAIEIDDLLNSTGLTEAEEQALQALADKAAALLDRIKEVAVLINRLSVAGNRYDISTVKTTDIPALEELQANIMALLNSENLTPGERTPMISLRSSTETLLARAREVAAEIARISAAVNGYDPATLGPRDKKSIEALIADIDELLASSNVTDEEKTTLSALREKAEGLLATIAGNSQSTVDGLLAALGAYDIDTVKSTDRAPIEAIKADIDALLAGGGLSDSDRERLREASATADALLARIEEAANAPVTESTQATAALNLENFTLADKATIEQAKADIQKALADYEGNYTGEEKAALNTALAYIEALLTSILRVETVQTAIGMIPEDANIKDHEIVLAIQTIENAYAQLTEHEKELVDRSLLDELLGLNDPYTIISGQNSSWQRGSGYALSFQASGKFSKFTGIKVDGVLLSEENYMAVDRNTVVNLSPAYLETLALGTHTLTVLYTDGEVSCTFTVAPAVGEQGPSYLWLIILIIVLCIAAGVVAVYIVMKNERNTGRR